MKSNSYAGIVLILIMLLLVLASLFWFLYSDYDTGREQAEMANSRATRVSAIELEAGQLRAEADQVKATRAVLEGELATAVFTQSTLEQELVNDQQAIQTLEASLAEQTPDDTVPEINIISPLEGSIFNLTDSVELVVAAIDPNGIDTINIIFDNNPPLEIPAGGETSVIKQELWPLSEIGEHTAVVTAVNLNNISSQTVSVTITVENKRTRQQIIDEVANIIGPTNNNEPQVAIENIMPRTDTTLVVLDAFDFAPPQNSDDSLTWGIYCDAITEQSFESNAIDEIDSPAKELALVQAIVRAWQESQYQLSQQLAATTNDDARAALCALAVGHERWVMEEYIRRASPDQQTILNGILTPLIALDTSDILATQQTFASAFGLPFFNEITQASGATAVIDAWNSPPQTTSDILHPNQYLEGLSTQTVTLPDLSTYLGDAWSPIITNSLGEFMLGQYLGNHVNSEVGETAVSGWQGDQYAIYQQGDDGSILLALQINWDSEQSALEFASIYEQYVNGRFAETSTPIKSPESSSCWSNMLEETICIYTNETQTIIVSAPEENLTIDTLEELVEPS